MAQPGDRLVDRYELVAPIGAGGMATVWRAFDLRLQRPVAVKLLRPQFAEDPEFVRRFETEARHAASLAHPNVATVFDTGIEGDEPFIVMELADGPTVADLLRDRGTLPAPLAVEVAAAAARALAAAHRRGLIHRDVKPANLLLARDGTVRLADFGIARALTTSRATAPGTVLGSIPYLSPEQARGEEATAAGDIFSLGVVLFEMLTGRLPWSADSPAALATVRLNVPPTPPSAVAADLPPGIDAVVGRALDLDPKVRYPSARAFAETLETWSRRFAATAPGPTPDLADTIAMVAAAAVSRDTDPREAGRSPARPGLEAAGAALAVDPAAPELDEPRIVASVEARPNPAPDWPAVPRRTSGPATAPFQLAPVSSVGSAPVAWRRGAPAAVVGEPAPGRDRRARDALQAVGALVIAVLLVAVGLAALASNEPRGGVAAGQATPSGNVAAVLPTATASPTHLLTPTPSPVPTLQPALSTAPVATAQPTPRPTSRPRGTPRPTTAPPRRSSEPLTANAAARAVSAFYSAAADHDWPRATARWSPSMQQRYPPRDWLIGRFRLTTAIDITRLETLSLNREIGTARVAVSLTEYRTVEPSPRRFSGAWDLVRLDGIWVLDDPDF